MLACDRYIRSLAGGPRRRFQVVSPSKEEPVMSDPEDVVEAETGRAPSDATPGAMTQSFDISSPQADYRAGIEAGGFFEPAPGMAIALDRATVEHVLRHHELFSSRIEMRLGNVRPLIPLNVDPPQHSKYRKLLDPLFAPKRMDEQEEDITRRVNGFIDQFIDRGECNFTEDFAELFPSSLFLGLMGLPEQDLRMFLRLRDGILHPEKTDPGALFDMDKRMAVNERTGQEIYDYFGSLIDERMVRPADDIVSRFLKAE